MHRIIFVLSTTGVVYLIEAIETISNPLFFFLFFFLQKDFERKKHEQKPTDKTKTSKQKTTEVTAFVCRKTTKGVKVGFFILHWVLFVHVKSFC